MQGAGQVNINPKSHTKGKGSLEYLVKDLKTAAKFAHLKDKKGQWVTRKDVWIRYDERQGGLRPGFGARNTTIGPELGFGTIVGDAIEEPVLLIKTCWGGKSIMVDFRPPSSGMPPKAMMEKMLKGMQRREPKATMKDVEAKVGFYYREMLSGVAQTLKNLKKYYPAYDGKGYEVVGFGWHGGHNRCVQCGASRVDSKLSIGTVGAASRMCLFVKMLILACGFDVKLSGDISSGPQMFLTHFASNLCAYNCCRSSVCPCPSGICVFLLGVLGVASALTFSRLLEWPA